ncbi:hypothetical protein QVD17_11481 [Tagetes erecta]|uniref:Uncharacterized protein n=1 Tax=Tagetes erecta TaxID=13708 RepID=A0AAD8KTJ9_TARER|nr:hypothetical protein QVD17_11481 [Tagetes erecta]
MIQNMVDKVPSFKTCGTSWFLDLTTADPFYILPCLTAFSFWITVEFNMQEGLEGNPAAGTMKNVSRGFAALTVPFTATFPKALFCYWITSNLFSLVYGLSHYMCPCQPGSTECGYYVMKFMKEIVDKGVEILVDDNVGGGKDEYTDADIDGIWEECSSFGATIIFR